MCGIVGVLNIQNKRTELQDIKRLTSYIAHRGPDDEGYFVEDNMALGHRRLSILDVSSSGQQPMISNDGRWVIVFNGCIYNYLELKSELLKLGSHFNSKTDTEVILEGIAYYGLSFIERLNGMFAIGVYDRKAKTLYLCRDKYGVKPLYYWFNKNCLVFASEIKAIIKHPDYKMDVDLSVLDEYFSFQNVFRYNTLFKGIKMLPAANRIKIDQNTKSIEHESWWDYDFTQADYTLTFEDAKNETLRLFNQAVTRQMVSDVPVGSYLSGGMDSGSITSIASKLVPRLTTFTCGFDMSSVDGVESNYDERRYAELMASRFNTEHYEQVINEGDLRWSLPRVVWHLEDLKVGMSYPNYYISRLASKFVKVCLQGTGGDELFGGYPWRYYKVFNSLDQKEFFEKYYNYWQRLIPDAQKSQLFTNSIRREMDPELPRKSFERVFTFNDKLKYDTPEEHIQNSLYFEIKTFLPGLLLVGDKLSMANGLEERFPFLDDDLVNFAQKIPVKYKLGNLEKELNRIDENMGLKKFQYYKEFDDGKNILRKAMSELLPERVLNRPKQGFSSPEESWYRGANAQYVKDSLLGKSPMYEFINEKYVAQTIDEHMNKKVNHRLRIWSFLCFDKWCRIFLNGEMDLIN